MNKKTQIWYRYNNDTKKLKTECVDLLSKCYLMLGQKPDTQQVVLMSQLLYDDLINNYSRLTMQEVIFAFEQAIKHSDNGNFVNVRNWNIWLKEYKEKARIKRQQNLLTDYQQHEKNIKLIGKTINKAKHLK
tara:strand:+ start:432 stop:827 length:396 start_codon:yes stop_codon:yes gene_type:complete